MDYINLFGTALVGALALAMTAGAEAAPQPPVKVEANHVAEITLTSAKTYPNPFMDAELVAVVTPPQGKPLRVPGFWAGGNTWRFRYASPIVGRHTWRTECSDHANAGLNGISGEIDVVANTDANPLYQHGPVTMAPDHRHFQYADGQPFFWLGDTWWKGLCKRLTWAGFQELASNREGKGFTVVQIVCGPYPDEATFQPSWENEGGMPYETHDFTVMNPAYFHYADRRIQCLVADGIVPAIVGGWGRPDCDSMALAGLAGMKRHWRNVIAHYGAYPTIWIIGGESGGLKWTELARYVREIDPYHRPITIHPTHSARDAVTDEKVLDFDMLQTGHGAWNAAFGAIPQIEAAYDRKPPMPALIGEYCYEGHMQTGWEDEQRYVFWASLLSGAAGLTYGAAGVWNASVPGDPGLDHIYDYTTWEEGMNYPGSTQLGRGKKLLLQYPWSRFEPHPEWTEKGSFAAGIPGRVRFIYMPKRGVYNWRGPILKGLERDVAYHAFYFDPAKGTRFDIGTLVDTGPARPAFEGPTKPFLFEDDFEGAGAGRWHDYGTPTERKGGRLVGHKGMVTIVQGLSGADMAASVEANTNAEACIILRFHDVGHYLVALYTPMFHALYIQDRKGGDYGVPLGSVPVPEIGPRVTLRAACCGGYVAATMTDGTHTYSTPAVKVTNIEAGPPGLWLYQVGDKQEYSNFEVSAVKFAPPVAQASGAKTMVEQGGACQAPNVPSPQDWVMVLEPVHR